MPFHTVAWAESLALVTNDDMAPVSDDILPSVGGLFLLPQDYYMLGAMVMGTTLDRATIVQPSIRVICDDFVRPVLLTLLPGDNAPMADYRSRPFPLRMNENLSIQATTSGAGPAVTSALAWLGTARGLTPAPSGPVYTLRGTGTTTAVVNGWTTTIVTWQNTLPQGRYSVVGLEAIGTTLKAARLMFPNQQQRPGCPGLATVGIRTMDGVFRKGGMGEWGQFDNWNLPIPQIFCGSADTAQTFYMDVIPLSL